MKQFIIIVFILFCSILFNHSKAFAGNYHPFVVNDSVYWNVTDEDQSGGPQYFIDHLHVFLMAGDSSYKGKTCKKIFIVGNSKTDITLVGFVRENNKQVFFKSVDTTKDTTERMLYDFSLQQGDSFKIKILRLFGRDTATGNYRVEGVDSEKIENSEYRKGITMDDQNSNLLCHGMRWIEGVGSINSLFYSVFPGCIFEHSIRLNCMTVNHVAIYGDPTYPCHTDAGINNVISQKDIQIYPDPANNYLKINNLPSSNLAYRYQIFNNLGQMVISETRMSNEQIIDISSLKTGVYFLQFVNTENGESLRTRFVKE